MRTNIPSFRLPQGCSTRRSAHDDGRRAALGSPIDSCASCSKGRLRRRVRRHRRAEGQGLSSPGPQEALPNIHIGITWLESVAFGHIKRSANVLIIGVGNTAMDCCRTSLRLGAQERQVMARKPRQFFKASPWELEDAEEENVEIVVNRSAEGLRRRERGSRACCSTSWSTTSTPGRITSERMNGEEFFPADDVILADRPENAFPGSSATSASSSTSGTCPVVDATHLPVHARRRVLRRRRGVRPERTSSGRSSTATRRRSRSTTTARAGRSPSACAPGMNHASAARWACTSGRTRTTTARSSAADAARVARRSASRRSTSRSSWVDRRAGRGRGRSAASTATCRRCSTTSCASSATPASTSARWTA